jgi:cytochrome c-type biogenesis protein CcsB
MNLLLIAALLIGLSIGAQLSGAAVLSRTLASSQAHIFAMGLASLAAVPAYAWTWWRRSPSTSPSTSIARLPQRLTAFACVLGLSGLGVRWFESYQLADGIGHVPISNLYEVFVLFVVIVSAMQLRLQARPALAPLGVFIAPVSAAAVGFLVWYAMARGAHELAPLVPALDSYWMKLHVPANFIGYGAFCLAAMCSAAWLMAGRPSVAQRLPPRALLEETSYRLIAIGFVAFTIATVLGALWAAEAWGGYWSWDPKETWALVVWLNYASWLHLRLVKGQRGPLLAWWSLVGLLITLFAFLGVNIYLSGLHSYGAL